MSTCEKCSTTLPKELPANCERCGKPVTWCVSPKGGSRIACDPKPVHVMLLNGTLAHGRRLHATTCKPPKHAPDSGAKCLCDDNGETFRRNDACPLHGAQPEANPFREPA